MPMQVEVVSPERLRSIQPARDQKLSIHLMTAQTPSVEAWIAGDLEFRDGATHFRVARKGEERARIALPLLGRHNVLNALATVALADGRSVPREAMVKEL